MIIYLKEQTENEKEKHHPKVKIVSNWTIIDKTYWPRCIFNKKKNQEEDNELVTKLKGKRRKIWEKPIS